MFFGYPFASSPGKMILIRADKRGLTKFFDDEFELSEVSWLNDHTMLINGRPVIPQGLGPAGKNSFVIGTYAPSLVYQLNDNLILDSVRTIKRNKENYIFKGFSADQDIWIAQPTENSSKGSMAFVFKEKGAQPPK